jgi:KDO2-lipid IV(A) lauroyltransferase
VHWPVWLGIGAGWLVAHLPWSLARRLARPLGWLLRHAMRARRHAVEVNLALCFPELDPAQRTRLLHENFRSLGMSVFEFLRAWWGPLAPLDRGFVLDGLENVERARADGRGVLLTSPHFTTLEICTRLLCAYVPVAGMYRPHRSAALDWAVRRGRLGHATQMFPRDALRPALRHLKEGGVRWFAPVQVTRRGESVFVPFFGQPAWSLTSTHAMARLGAARVLPLFLERLPDGRYRVEIGAPLEDFPSTDARADTARVMAMIEAQVRRAPAQYLWVHKRFKIRPDGQPSPYR